MKYKIHPLADVQSEQIGENTTVWQYSIILKGAKLGADCNINCHVFIENDVEIGNAVTIKSGVQIWDGIRIGNHVFVGPNVTFTNDKYPRSKKYPDEFLKIIIKDGASIGAASIIMGGVVIGNNSMIGAGSLVTKSIPDNELWYGTPARFIKKIESINA
jgi:UDP-2-acetamido-3-amino-2,3-dideoxy-glucuronate N-acetyltransferase